MRLTDSALRKQQERNKRQLEDFVEKARIILENNSVDIRSLEKKQEQLRDISAKTLAEPTNVDAKEELSNILDEIAQVNKEIELRLVKDVTLRKLFEEYQTYVKKISYLESFLKNIAKKCETFEE